MPNLDFYGMFDFVTGDGDTYKYTSEEWANYISALNGNGVVKAYKNEFACTKSGMNVTVKTGGCFINGHFGMTTANKTITFLPTSSGTEVHSIILTLDVANRVIRVEEKTGTSYTQTASYYEMPIYQVSVTTSAITLTDVREYIYGGDSVKTMIDSFSTQLAAKPSSLSDITGTLAIAKGGTGATTAAAARTALGAAAASHTHAVADITGTLPISKGGTGATTASAALTNLGVIYSATQPTYQAGAIWLKPVE